MLCLPSCILQELENKLDLVMTLLLVALLCTDSY